MTAFAPSVASGRLFNEWEMENEQPVALLGIDVSRSSGLWTGAGSTPSIWIGGKSFAVVGTVYAFEANPALSGSVIVPRGALPSDIHADSRIVLRTDEGTSSEAAARLEVTLSHLSPRGGFSVTAVPDSTAIRSVVSGDLQRAFELVSLGAIIVSVFATWLATRSSFVEREAELGLRKSLGASTAQILLLLGLEGTVVGLVGGAVGVLATSMMIETATRLGVEIAPSRLMMYSPFLLGVVSGLSAAALFGRATSRLSAADAFRV